MSDLRGHGSDSFRNRFFLGSHSMTNKCRHSLYDFLYILRAWARVLWRLCSLCKCYLLVWKQWSILPQGPRQETLAAGPALWPSHSSNISPTFWTVCYIAWSDFLDILYYRHATAWANFWTGAFIVMHYKPRFRK